MLGRSWAPCGTCVLLHRTLLLPLALPGAGGGDRRLRVRRSSAPAVLGSPGQLFPLDGVPGDDPDAAASVEILSFEVTCADS